jgi:hypothetical protein
MDGIAIYVPTAQRVKGASSDLLYQDTDPFHEGRDSWPNHLSKAKSLGALALEIMNFGRMKTLRL